MLLIHPPISKPSEPPPGLACLYAHLKAAGKEVRAWDANIEGLLWLMRVSGEDPGGAAWRRRAVRGFSKNLAGIRNPALYASFPAYMRAVSDLGRLLTDFAPGWRLSLTNLACDSLSPVRSCDLLAAAEQYTKNPFYTFFSEKLDSFFAARSFGTIGISVNFLSQALTAFAIAGYARRAFPGVRIVMGGGLITSWLCRYNLGGLFGGLIDRFVSGPVDSADALAAVTGGVAGNKACSRGTAYDYTPFDLDAYLSPGRVIPLNFSSGCWWGRCSFCPERAEGNRYTPLGVARAGEIIEELTARYRPALLHITDNAISLALLKHVASRPPGAPWYGFARITAELGDTDLCVALKRSGCAMLCLGIESGSDRVLQEMNKGFDTSLAETVLKNLAQAGIPVYAYLLFGTPWETGDDANKTLDFCVRNSSFIDYMNVSIFNLPVSSPEAGHLETRPFYDGDLALYTDFTHPNGWSRSSVRSFLEKEFKRHMAISPIIRRDPPSFTSNHAPFFAGMKSVS
jgi:hypothetical protein